MVIEDYKESMNFLITPCTQKKRQREKEKMWEIRVTITYINK